MVLETSRKKLPEGFNSDNDIDDFFDLVNSAFLHRRKKLLNSLSLNAGIQARLKRITTLLDDIGKDQGVRAEDLSLEDYISIFNMLKKNYLETGSVSSSHFLHGTSCNNNEYQDILYLNLL